MSYKVHSGVRGRMRAMPSFVRLPGDGVTGLSMRSSEVATLRAQRLRKLDRLLFDCSEALPVTRVVHQLKKTSRNCTVKS